MNVCVYESSAILGKEAARLGAAKIREAIASKGKARVILATGASQFAMLDQLIKEKGIAWDRVDAFHLDEYVGISSSHGASFRKYLQERFAAKIPSLKSFTYVEGDAPSVGDELKRLGELVKAEPIDVAFIGIGENGHLAFNDPPADVETEEAYIVVTLDEKCRLQQVGEGWFKDLQSVPTQAISMSMHQILQSKTIVCTVPDIRKADAMELAVTSALTPYAPCAYLRNHADCFLMADMDSASKILARPKV